MPHFRRYKWEEMADTCWSRFLADEPTRLAVDTETTGLTWQDKPFGMSVAWYRPSGVIETGWLELENSVGLSRARDFIQWHQDKGQYIFFNAKFDIRILTNHGLWHEEQTYDYVDVMPYVALLEPIGEHKLKHAMRKYLGIVTNEETAKDKAIEQYLKEHKGVKKKDVGWHLLPRQVIVPYARMDASGTLQLEEKLGPMVEERVPVANRKEQRLVGVMLNMERRGLQTVPERVKEAIKVCDGRIAVARAEVERLTGRKVGDKKKKIKVERGLSTNPKTPDRMLYKTIEVPDEFNTGAWQQIVEMFNSRGHKISSSKSEVLLRLDDPLVAPLLELRSEEKLRGTYLLPLLREADEKGIVHPNFNQFGTGTGRFSSGAVK